MFYRVTSLFSLFSVLIVLGVTVCEPSEKDAPLTVEDVLNWVDKQMTFDTRSAVATMKIVENKRERIKKMKIFSRGIEDSFIIFEAPKRDKGVKFLKIGGNLWTYFPTTEKVIKISGHLLRQSMMGSDFSYEDMMESKDLLSSYQGRFLADETVEGQLCYVIELEEKEKGTSYPRRISWISKETFLPVKEERYAKTGKLLKVITFHDVAEYENRRYPKRFIMQDMLKKKSKTEFIIAEVIFHIPVPEGIFNKRNLNRSIQF